MKFDKTITFATLAYFALASDVQPRDVSGTANVYFGDELGEPGLYAAGFIYGIPDQADQIPDEFYDNFGFKYTRAGGAQTDAAGWIDGLDSYKARFTSALSNYQTALQHGGKFILLPHDIWGADAVQSSTAPFPGDDGNWTSFDQYLDTLIADMNDNDMQADLTIDIWNEPNGSGFWNREQSQYLDMWGRAYARFRDAFPDVPISGPSTSYSPTDDDWWSAWFEFIVANNSIPDEHSWHGLSSSFGDARQMVENYDTLLESYGGARNDGPVVINEYGAVREQNPAGSAWWIAQLERANIWGLRANWESGLALHDFFGQILGKPTAGADDYDAEGTGYYTTAEYLVYKYYASTMTGTRVRTEPTEDVIGDVYVTVDDGVVRMLVGTRYSTGEWTIQLNNLTELGLPESGTLDIQALGFPGTEDKYVEVDEATDLGTNSHDYSDGTLSFAIDMTDLYATWAFEFSV